MRRARDGEPDQAWRCLYHLQWYQGEKKRRKSLRTDSLQIAKQKLRQFESAKFQGHDCPLPTRTPIGEVVAAFVEHMKAHRPERSWKRDVSYLRELFGECCPELEIGSEKARKCQRLRLPDDKRKKLWPISAPCFEEITTGAISEFIAARVRIRGLAPKTANRYREVVNKVFNWVIARPGLQPVLRRRGSAPRDHRRLSRPSASARSTTPAMSRLSR